MCMRIIATHSLTNRAVSIERVEHGPSGEASGVYLSALLVLPRLQFHRLLKGRYHGKALRLVLFTIADRAALLLVSGQFMLLTVHTGFTSIMACHVFRGVALGMIHMEPLPNGLTSTAIANAFQLDMVASYRGPTSNMPAVGPI
ncbi:hypothetical protein FIBSPDRAFT_899854 [Athelia psychrophila]|uniref:Uncharacterized protein n=1 Tax=Athelia psychrophila TaxID=1759441 RepID=A0A165Z5K3_9AGAM|nr:hypothetical protein FIBSPDRAFT_899854 [Fibularhizoctonia sp. CBS 109695]